MLISLYMKHCVWRITYVLLSTNLIAVQYSTFQVSHYFVTDVILIFSQECHTYNNVTKMSFPLLSQKCTHARTHTRTYTAKIALVYKKKYEVARFLNATRTHMYQLIRTATTATTSSGLDTAAAYSRHTWCWRGTTSANVDVASIGQRHSRRYHAPARARVDQAYDVRGTGRRATGEAPPAWMASWLRELSDTIPTEHH